MTILFGRIITGGAGRYPQAQPLHGTSSYLVLLTATMTMGMNGKHGRHPQDTVLDTTDK